MSKAIGEKIAIKFDQALVGDVSGVTPSPVGGFRVGDDVAEGKTASAGSVRHATTYAASLAVDGNESTQWEPAYRVLSWHKADLGEAKIIRGMVHRRAAGGAATGFYVDGSNDDTNWDRVLTIESGSPITAGLYIERDFGDNFTYRYWRVTVTARSGDYPGFSILQYCEPSPIGNEQAFIVTGEEKNFLDGEPTEREYVVNNVEAHPTEPNTILLTMFPLTGPEEYGGGRFRDVVGNLTVAYDMTKGNLAGIGGAVLSFEDVFTPTDLLPLPSSAGQAEKLDASITNYELGTIAPVGGYGPEILETSITNYELELRDPLDP